METRMIAAATAGPTQAVPKFPLLSAETLAAELISRGWEAEVSEQDDELCVIYEDDHDRAVDISVCFYRFEPPAWIVGDKTNQADSADITVAELAARIMATVEKEKAHQP